MAGTVAPNIVTDGLVLYLDAANTKSYPGSGTTWTDMVAGSAATLINQPTFNNSDVGTFVLDGSNDQISIGSRNGTSFIDTDDMTLSVFLKINNKNTSGVLGRFTSQASSDGWCVWVYNNKLIFFNTNTNNNYDPNYASTGYSFINGEWFHFCVTRNSTTKELKWYVNGQLNQEYTTSLSIFKKTNNGISIGHLGNNYFLNGSIGPCYIYNKALSSQEILQNYNATKTRFGI